MADEMMYIPNDHNELLKHVWTLKLMKQPFKSLLSPQSGKRQTAQCPLPP